MPSYVVQLNIILFPSIILIILYVHNRVNNAERTLQARLFGGLIISLGLTMTTFSASLVFEGLSGEAALLLNTSINTVYLFASGVTSALWNYYVSVRLFGEGRLFTLKKHRSFTLSIFAINSIIVLLNPLSDMIFAITPDNSYQRGDFFWLPYLFAATLSIHTLIPLIRAYRTEPEKKRRNELNYLVFFCLTPFPGIIVQLFVDNWFLCYPICVVGMLVIYINLQNNMIVTDGLTGLNNRNEFERFIYSRINRRDDKTWALFLLDVDSFKAINDVYGHAAGDDALRYIADALRGELAREDAFIARTGGDEFAVICDCGDEAEAELIQNRIYSVIGRTAKRAKIPYSLAVSVGYALCNKKSSRSIPAIYSQADGNMYKAKELHKTEA